MNQQTSQTYPKSRFRWLGGPDTWPYYKRIVGCTVDCEADCAGWLLISDGTKISVSDLQAARILVFARSLEQNTATRFVRLRLWAAKILLGV